MAAVRNCPAWVIAAALAVAYLLIDPPSADLAAQAYRSDLFSREGFVLWDNAWYAGHHMPGYSVLFPPLGAWLGPRLVGALAAVAAAWLFERLADEHFTGGHRAARAGEVWFAVATAVNLVTGRLTFALGVAFALAAVLAATRRRNGTAAAAGFATALASPVAGAFLALGATAWFLGGGRERRGPALALGAAGLAPVLFLSVAFPEGGVEPFAASAFWPALLALVAVRLALPGEERVLRVAVDLYIVATVASFLLATPMGGNVTRLGAIFAMPMIAALLWRRRPVAVLLLAVPLLYWQWYPPVRDWQRAHGDPSVQSSYYDGLVAFMRAAPGPPFRVEVPFTANHWEARWLAAHVPLARGWERQLDRKVNGLFYDTGHPLTAARYTAWLHGTAVRFVAVPDVALDDSAREEAALIASGVPALRPVWRDAHWRVYAVRGARPIAPGLVSLGTDSFALRAAGPGDVPTRIRWTPYWHADGGACLAREGDWTVVRARRAGLIRVSTRFAPGRIGDDGCG